MTQPVFTIKQGDTLEAIEAILNDSVNTDFSISGWTIRFNMRSIKTGILVIDNALATIVNATTRRVKYNWAVGDTLVAGDYIAEFEGEDSGGKILTFPNKLNEDILVHIVGEIG